MRQYLALVLLAGITCQATAQINVWTGNGPGVWSDATKWSQGVVPGSGWQARINDGSTVTIDLPTPILSYVRLGAGLGEAGQLILGGASSELYGDDLSVGQSGTGHLQLEAGSLIQFDSISVGHVGSASSGTVVMNHGEMDVTSLLVGVHGQGVFDMYDGLMDVNGIVVGQQATSNGVFTQHGGTIMGVGSSMHIGLNGGDGTVSLLGGESDFNVVKLGFLGTGGTAAVLNIGGVAEVGIGTLIVGESDDGLVNQTGGSLVVEYILLTSASTTGQATYELHGGVLDVDRVVPGSGLSKTFTMTGGTLSLYVYIGDPADPLNLDPTGGLVLPRGKQIGPMTVYGNFDLGAGASVRYQLDTPFTFGSDRIIVIGSVKLQGTLLGITVTPSNAGNSFKIIDNDGTDPVIGTFAGLPEGATVTFYNGPDPYNYEITYVGGDGNDVVLNFVDCPADFTNDGILDNGDIGAFITLFLAGDLVADVNNDGFLDNGDIAMFITLFLAGC